MKLVLQLGQSAFDDVVTVLDFNDIEGLDKAALESQEVHAMIGAAVCAHVKVERGREDTRAKLLAAVSRGLKDRNGGST